MRLPTAKKTPSGGWRVQIRTGKGKRVSITRDTRAEAETAAMALKLRVSNSADVERAVLNTLTLSQAIDLYIEDTKDVLSPSTIRSYRAMQKYRFKTVMDTPLSADTNWQYVISREKKCPVMKVYHGKMIETDQTVSAKTVKNAWGLVGTVLKYFKLPVPDVRLPKSVKEEHKFLDPDEIRVFLKAIEGHRFELPYLLCLHGLRRSEMLAVSKGDIVTPKAKGKEPYIRVRGAAVYDENNHLVEKSTNKTEKSTRDVPVFISRLLHLVKEMPDGKLCTASPSSMTHPLNVVLKNNGLPEVGLHGLRHTFASLCYHLQIPSKVTQRWGGWANASVVDAVYTHLAERDEKESIEKIKGFYRKFE